MDRSVFMGYREMGFTPIPLQPRGKRPRLATWKEYQSRQPTDAEIDAWLAAGDCNVGLVMGRGLFALDCDGDWGACLGVLATHGIFLPEDAPRQKTGKGNHVLMMAPFPVNDFVGLFKAPGVNIDVRGVGYIAAAPSIHPSGHCYEWVTQPTTRPPAAPAALLARLRKEPLPAAVAPAQSGIIAGDAKPAWVTELMAGVGEGGRDAACTRLAGYFLQSHAPDVVESILEGWAVRCTPPFPLEDMRKCVRSIDRRAASQRDVPPVEESRLRSLGDILAERVQTVKEPTKFLRLPYDELNALLFGGMLTDEYMIIAARPSVGKSAMAHEIAWFVASSGTRVLLVSLEMGERSVADRMAARESGIDAGRIRQGGLEGAEYARFVKAYDKLTDLPVYIESRISSAETLVQLVKDRGPFGLVIVDFIQKMRTGRGGDDRRLEIDAVSTALDRGIAKAQQTPVIALSSVSRPKEKDDKVGLASLKESSGLESDADIVVLLTRKNLKDPLVDVEVGKARNAKSGSFQLRYDGDHFTFSSPTMRPHTRALGGSDDLPF